MKNLIILVCLIALGWHGYQRFQEHQLANTEVVEALVENNKQPLSLVSTGASYKCDGRLHCSQMNSCAEATYFIQNCPGTKMDGNGDGIPCEKQWCK